MEGEVYNVAYNVKYDGIERELLHIVDTRPTPSQAQEQVGDGEVDYTEQDVLNICNKLYRDELASVFYLNTVEDDGLTPSLHKLHAIVSGYPDFVDLMSYFKTDCSKQSIEFTLFGNIMDQKDDSFYFFLLFGQPIFHLTHKCIVSLMTAHHIPSDLLDDIKQTLKRVFR